VNRVVAGCVAAAIAAVGLLSIGIAVAPVGAQEAAPSKTLLPGKGADLTMQRCAICHDITHVTRSRLSRDEWEDNIKVMIARGMPIEPHEIPIVVEYLATYYNRDKPPPAAEAPSEQPAGSAAPIAGVLAANGCTACHAAEKRVIGPGFREISAKYRGEGQAAAYLARKVKEGGAGAWGPVPMPPHPQISDNDLARIATWVLQQ